MSGERQSNSVIILNSLPPVRLRKIIPAVSGDMLESYDGRPRPTDRPTARPGRAGRGLHVPRRYAVSVSMRDMTANDKRCAPHMAVALPPRCPLSLPSLLSPLFPRGSMIFLVTQNIIRILLGCGSGGGGMRQYRCNRQDAEFYDDRRSAPVDCRRSVPVPN